MFCALAVASFAFFYPVLAATPTEAIAAARVKNDAVDARTLPHLLRTNLLPEAWIAPPEAREAGRRARRSG